MIPARPRPIRRAALLLLAVAAVLGPLPGTPQAAVVAGSLVVRAEGRAPILGGREDVAQQQALDESFRRALLESLRVIAPERQSPRDLETWQETILSRAGDFVGAWRILSLERRDGFLSLEAEIEIWRDKLARAARSSGPVAAAPAVRLLVLADPLPLAHLPAEEEIDAGRAAAAALEAEFSRRGAVIVGSTDQAPREEGGGPASEENRVALAAAAAKRLGADAVLLAQVLRRGEDLVLSAQLVAAVSEATLASARTEVPLKRDEPLAETFAPAARRIAAALSPRLAAARSSRGHGAPP